MPRSIHPELLETFDAVVRHDGDAGQAANSLGLTQPTMSKRLAHLQYPGELIQRPWLRREGKTWLLTDEGQRVLPAVRELLRQQRALYEFTHTPFGSQAFRFACGQTAAAYVVRETLAEFRRRDPDARVRISTMRAPQRIAAVASGAVDLAMVSRSDDEISEWGRGVRLAFERIGSEGFFLVCSDGGPWSAEFDKLPKRKPVALDVLRTFPLIVPEPDSHTRRMLDPRILSMDWADEVEYVVQTGGWRIILEYARDGHGVALVDELALPRDDRGFLAPRRIDPESLPLRVVKLISRRSPDAPDGRDLSEPARLWARLLSKCL